MPFFTDLAWPLLLLVAVSTCRATTTPPTRKSTCVPWEKGPNPALDLKLVNPPYIKVYDWPNNVEILGNLYVGSYKDLNNVAASPRLKSNWIYSVVIPKGLSMRCWSDPNFKEKEYNVKGPWSGDLTSAEGPDDWESCKVYPNLGYYVDIYHGYSFQPSIYDAKDLASASFYKDDCSDLPHYGTGTKVITWEDPWFTGTRREYPLGDYSTLANMNTVDSVSIPLGMKVLAYHREGFDTSMWFWGNDYVTKPGGVTSWTCPGGNVYQLDFSLGVNDWDSMRVVRASWCSVNSQRKDVCGVMGSTDEKIEGKEFNDPGCQRDNYCNSSCPLQSIRLLGEDAPQATTLGLKVLYSAMVANCGDKGTDSVNLKMGRAKAYTEKTSITVKKMEWKSWSTTETTGISVAATKQFSFKKIGKFGITVTGSYDVAKSTGGKTSLTNSETSDLSTTLQETMDTAISVPVNFATLLMVTSTAYEIQSKDVSAEFTYMCKGEEPKQEIENSSIHIEANRWDSPTVRPLTKSFPSIEKCKEMRDGCLFEISHAGIMASALEMEAKFLACFAATPIDPFTEGSGAPTIALGTASLVSALSLMLA